MNSSDLCFCITIVAVLLYWGFKSWLDHKEAMAEIMYKDTDDADDVR